MELQKYPQVIADTETAYYLDVERKKHISDEIALYNARLEFEIAGDQSLRNEQMRKSKKLVVRSQDDEYSALMDLLQETERTILTAQVYIDRLKREFSLLKLEKQEAIARMQSTGIASPMSAS